MINKNKNQQINIIHLIKNELLNEVRFVYE